MSNTRRLHRLLAAGALLVAGSIMLSGCAIDYFAKTNDGQQRVDRAIADAGLSDSVTADYGCTGAMPLTATTCRARVTITTDDVATIQRAAEVDVLRAETAETSWSVIFRGVEYAGWIDDLIGIEPIADALPTGIEIDSIQVGGDLATIRARGVDSFDVLCALSADLADVASVTSRLGTTTDFTVGAGASESDGYADACALADSAVAALGAESLSIVEITTLDDGVLEVRIIPDSEESFEAAEAWGRGVSVPAGVELSIPIYY